jgi:hypothetical protein
MLERLNVTPKHVKMHLRRHAVWLPGCLCQTLGSEAEFELTKVKCYIQLIVDSGVKGTPFVL